jgi:hypothetical protein
MLAKLGESPAEHQATVHSILNKTYTTKLSTKREPNVHDLNRETEKRLSHSAPSSLIAASLESKQFVAEEWVPDAYVLFTRRWRCRCGQAGVCLDRPELYLRHHHIRQRKKYNEDETGPGLRYIPVKLLAYEHLPRLREVVFKALTVCETCFEKAKGVVSCQQPEPKLSASEDTESSKLAGLPLVQLPPDALVVSLISPNPEPSRLPSKDINTGLLSTEVTSGSGSPSLYALISDALAALSSSPTNEVVNV